MEFKCCTKNSLEAENVSKTYAFLRAIADPNRLKILCLLRNDSICVCKIAPLIKISDKLASHHLKQLKKIDLLIEKRKGNFIYYELNHKSIKNYKFLFDKIIKIL